MTGSPPDPVEAAYALVEGAYALVEWRDGATIQTPPEVEGRFILKDGVIVTILSHHADPQMAVSITQYGRFTLDRRHFAYGYDHGANFRHTADGIVVLPLLAPGWRSFAVSVAPDAVHLTTDAAGFVFTPEGMTYSEEGICLRRWRRLGRSRRSGLAESILTGRRRRRLTDEKPD